MDCVLLLWTSPILIALGDCWVLKRAAESFMSLMSSGHWCLYDDVSLSPHPTHNYSSQLAPLMSVSPGRAGGWRAPPGQGSHRDGSWAALSCTYHGWPENRGTCSEHWQQVSFNWAVSEIYISWHNSPRSGSCSSFCPTAQEMTF